MEKKPLIIVAGPTAVGKSRMGILLAQAADGEIISADSMQVYRGMDIGTAKVTSEERTLVPHHLLDIASPLDGYSVAQFKEDAQSAVDEICARGHVPIVVGGTGFYIQALLYDIDFEKESGEDPAFRDQLAQFAKQHGTSALHAKLEEVDPDAAAVIHPHNIKRVIRALEFYHHTGREISDHNRDQSGKESPYRFIFFVMTDERARLYDRIDKRAEEMVRNGLVEETRELVKTGCLPESPAMQALGYRETLRMLQKQTLTDDDLSLLTQEIALNTRHYAKRQLTWFRREKDVIWLSWEEYNEASMLETMIQLTRKRGII